MSAYRSILLLAAACLGACASYPAVEAPVASVAAPQLRPGEHWTYDQIDPYKRSKVRTLTYTLEAREGGFELVGRSDRAGDPVQTERIAAPWRITAQSRGDARRSFDPGLAQIAFPLAPGKRWKETVRVNAERGATQRWSVSARAVRWESVKVPAGEFKALRVERWMNLGDADASWGNTSVSDIFWYAPEVKRWVRRERRTERIERVKDPRVERDWTVWELAAR